MGILQTILTVVLFISLPLWKNNKNGSEKSTENSKALSLPQILKIRGVKLVLITFFCYCTVESTAGLWASSYLVEYRGIGTETAANFASLFFLGITCGRFLSGFISDKLGDKLLIRCGIIVIVT